MQCLGETCGWVFFEHAENVVAVDSSSFDTTGLISGGEAQSLIAEASAGDGDKWHEPEPSQIHDTVSLLASAVFATALPPSPACPAPIAASARSVLYPVPAEASASAKRALQWQRRYKRGGSDLSTGAARLLAAGQPLPLSKIRNIALYWASAPPSKAGDSELSAKSVPSNARIEYGLWGGDAGREWSKQVFLAAIGESLLASAYDPDAGMTEGDVPEEESALQDPGKPHRFEPALGDVRCTYCDQREFADIHDPEGPVYSQIDVDPDSAHFFNEDLRDPASCAICGREVDHDLHKQAALADYYEFRQLYDQLYADDAVFREKNAGKEAVTADASIIVMPDPVERAAVAREGADELFWERQGHEDEDPLTYFVSHPGEDEMVVDALYVFDGKVFYRLDAEQRLWMPDQIPPGEHIYAIDDDTAYIAIGALLFSPEPFDLRDADPAESQLMESCVPHLDLDALDRALTSAGGILAPAEGPDDYTAEERARNASRQGRDSSGRFAPGGGGGEEQAPAPQRSPNAKAVLTTDRKPLSTDELKALFDGFGDYVDNQRSAAPAAQTAAAPPVAAETTASPEQSDVKPINLAIMDPGDTASVLELVSLVPATAVTKVPKLFRRVAGGKWEEDLALLRQMQGLHPPIVQTLDDAQFGDVLAQVDQFYVQEQNTAQGAPAEGAPAEAALYDEFGILVAGGIPGIADTPGDIAAVARLKKYWTVGKGGLKIAWNTPGDWTRCNRYLRKYMGPRAKGYCANLHKLMTGVWPGDRRNIGKRKRRLFATLGDPYDVVSSETMLARSAQLADAEFADGGYPLRASAVAVPETGGAKFIIKVLAPVGVKSGDGRHIHPEALTHRELPIPLLWQIKTMSGHDESVIVGRIDSIDKLADGSLGNARGVFDTGPYGREAERMVREKFLRGVSVDLDKFEAASEPGDAEDGDEAAGKIAPTDMMITKGRAMAATLVAKPSFQECSIELDEETEELPMVADGTYIADPSTDDEFNLFVQSALVAAGVPLHPPKSWFSNPDLAGPTPLTVTDDGRVFGHIATWDVDHIGLPFSTRPPKSRSGYAYFHTGTLRTDEGEDVPVGQLTLAGGHADLHANAQMAAKHYDDTDSAVADLRVGEDLYGIWASGALRPSVDGEQLRAIRAAAPSGDWRPINGRLELVAVCQVNVPGFPTTRAMVASGQVSALVAAGTTTLNRIRSERGAADGSSLESRLASLEADRTRSMATRAAELSARMAPALQEQEDAHRSAMAALSARVAPALQQRDDQNRAAMAALSERVEASGDDEAALFRYYTQEKRDEYAKKGAALPDGSYPIATVADLKNAIRAYGRAKNKAAVRRHIRKRARALGKTELIPESWSEAAVRQEDGFADIAELYGPVIAAGGRYPDGTPWDPDKHPRDDRGRFRKAIARIREAAEKARKEALAEAAERAKDAEESGDVDAAVEASRALMKKVDSQADHMGDIDTADELREANRDLGTAVANLPLAMGDLNDKFRFTELPPELQQLIKDLLSRVESLLEPEHAEKAGHGTKRFISGIDLLSQPEISAELSRMLRYLI